MVDRTFSLPLQVHQSVLLEDAVSLQELINLVAHFKPEQPSQAKLGQTAAPVLLGRQRG